MEWIVKKNCYWYLTSAGGFCACRVRHLDGKREMTSCATCSIFEEKTNGDRTAENHNRIKGVNNERSAS